MDSDEDYSDECKLDEYESASNSESDSEEEYPYEILDPEEIKIDMLKKIKFITRIFQVSKTTAQILLHHFKWDEEKLLDDYYSKDRASIFKAAGLVDPLSVSKSKKLPSDSTEFCEICLSPFIRSLMTGLECGHRFCGDCWAAYLSVKVMSEGECLSISCPAHKCEILVDDVSAMALIKDSKVRSKYQCLITQGFVERNRLLKWCPAPDCNRAVKVQYVNFKPVKCTCGHRFCFKCSETWHAPISCEHLRKWMKKADEDYHSRFRKCPRCPAMLQKRGARTPVTCRKCKYKSCSACSRKWPTDCLCFRSLNDGEANEVNQESETAKSALEKYLFHSIRFYSHLYSVGQDRYFMKNVRKKMMHRFYLSSADVQFWTKAVDVLDESRRALAYSYAFAYFVEESNHKTLFENNQQDMISAMDALLLTLKGDIENAEVDKIKRKVQDETRYCEKRCKILLDHCKEGYDRDWWRRVETT